MTRLVRGTELSGMPIVTLSGEDIAEVRDVVYDAGQGGLVGFTLNKRGFFSGRLKEILTIDCVTSIGRDAVIVADDEALTDRGDAPETLTDASSDRDVIGAAVTTDSGHTLGRVTDVVVRLGKRATAVGYELASSDEDARRLFVPLPEQLAVSGDTLMVPSGLDEFVRDDLTGFGGAVEEYRAEHQTNGDRGASRRADGSAASNGRSSRTKAELYEEARERDISGRSSMTKAELVDALADGGGRA